MLSPVAAREAVHITLLARLLNRVPDGLRLKGGVNLRLFYDSPRYSEDMDLDADPRHGRDRQKLLRILDEIVKDGSYKRQLERLGINDVVANKKQDAAGKSGLKFKLQVLIGGTAHDTKVEISFRESTPARWATATPIPERRLKPYGLPTFEVQRYDHAAAAAQKVNALATRGQTQARDIFDLFLLFDQTRWPGTLEQAVSRIRLVHTDARLSEARNRCLEATDEQFQNQVETFLEEPVKAAFAGQWDAMRLSVAEVLETALVAPTEDPE